MPAFPKALAVQDHHFGVFQNAEKDHRLRIQSLLTSVYVNKYALITSLNYVKIIERGLDSCVTLKQTFETHMFVDARFIQFQNEGRFG